jgi:hypothetical protein
VLDEDEFSALSLSPQEHEAALTALSELQVTFREKFRASE